MARLRRNLGEWVSGKVGNVVFVTTKNFSYVRAVPIREPGSWKKSQINHRQRISAVGSLWRSVKNDLNTIIWESASEKMSRFPWFLKMNIYAFALDGSLIDPKLILVSDGGLPKATKLSVEKSLETPTTILINWENDPNELSARMNDQLTYRIYGEGNFSEIKTSNLNRQDLMGTLEIADFFPVVNPTHVFIFWNGNNFTKFSQSVCFEINN